MKLDCVNTSSAVLPSSEKKKRKRHGKVERARFKEEEAKSEFEELRNLLGRSAQLNSLNASFANDLAVHLTGQKPLSFLPSSAVSQIVPASVVNSVERSLVDNSGNNSEKGLQEYSDRGSPNEQTSATSPIRESPTSPFETASSTTEGLNFVGAHLEHRKPSLSPLAYSQYSPPHQDIPPSPIFIPNSPYQPQSPHPQITRPRRSYRGNSRRRPQYNQQRRRRYDSYRPPRNQPTLTREE